MLAQTKIFSSTLPHGCADDGQTSDPSGWEVVQTNALKDRHLWQNTRIEAGNGHLAIDRVVFEGNLVMVHRVPEGRPAMFTFVRNTFKNYNVVGFRQVVIFGSETVIDGDLTNGSSTPALLILSEGIRVTGELKHWSAVHRIPSTETCEHHPVAQTFLDSNKN